jgi:hypothetical protein
MLSTVTRPVPFARSPVGRLSVAAAYFRPRAASADEPDTGGDRPRSSAEIAALGGFAQGFISGGPLLGAGSALGSWAGMKVGNRSHGSRLAALSAAAAVGGVSSAAMLASWGLLTGATLAAPPLLAAATFGALSAAAGTFFGSWRAVERDSAIGGLMLGRAAQLLAGGAPLIGIAGTIAGGIAGTARTPAGGAVLGAASGLVLGALAGAPYGWVAAGVGAAIGAFSGGAGRLIGTGYGQLLRNVSQDARRFVMHKLDRPLNTWQRAGIVTVASSAVVGPMGLMFGLHALPLSIGAGLAIGAVTSARHFKQWRQHDREQAAAPRAG